MTILMKNKIKAGSIVGAVLGLILTVIGSSYSFGISNQKTDDRITTLEKADVQIIKIREELKNDIKDQLKKLSEKLDLLSGMAHAIQIDIAVIKSKIPNINKPIE